MRVMIILLSCFFFYNTDACAQQAGVLNTTDSIKRLFVNHFKILDKAARKSRADTVYCCTSSVDFMEGYTKIEPETEGSFTGRWGFTKVALKQWHEWYNEKYKKKETGRTEKLTNSDNR